MAKNDITAEYVRSILDYDPETGIFRRRVRRRHYKAGTITGCADPRGRWLLSINGRLFLGYRVAYLIMTGEWPAHMIDHIDGDPSNNRWSNLRPASCAENTRNRNGPQKNSRSGYLGVNPHGNKWQASIRFNGVSVHLGRFDTKEEAATARALAAQRLFGEFMSASDRQHVRNV